ncbi:helix-turn-helix transcriptional regulator [Peptococcaceae bacterium]|nr:helix-turn-helix transcriptional regulator [Peptococcaceae bacterium]MCL0041989.1 helix-turn-helix transcriptional regulator [Peptococcaceae bacterium]MCL0052727.1 helix-turn-helix transcriptional regulator [Peptococcaceae bacterium]MCL0063345.1 helix-turn-helix transcriptional regulator [Peptococcaceae bacterium]MCL0100565.1 helix-turn-helix transcriptional regulator [Peptococcaceae bacterium]
MAVNKKILSSPWDLIEELADDKTKEYFELDDILIDISLKIINYRINNNLTQKQLAEKLGISQTMVSKLESGEYNPTIGQLWKISKKLGWNFKVSFGEEIETQIWSINDDYTLFPEICNNRDLEKIGEIA